MAHFIAIVVCFIIPIASYSDIKRLKKTTEPKAKTRMYILICAWYLLITAAVLYVTPLPDLYYAQVNIDFNTWFVCLAIGIIGFWLFSTLLPPALLRFSRTFREKLGAELVSNRFIYPDTKAEAKLFALLSVIVGIAEEIIFRAFLFDYFQGEPFGLSPVLSFAFVCFIFGLIHFLQGTSGIIQAGLYGYLYGFLYLVSGNLLAPIIIHIIYDIRILILSRMLKSGSQA